MRNLFYQVWPDAKEHIQQSEGVVITLGSVEEHGQHLPMGTDTILAHAITEEFCEREDMYYYPCVTFGQVWSARDFEGTISISPDCLKRYCRQVLDSVMKVHPKRVFLFSFHNGNHKVIDEVLRERYDDYGPENIYQIKASGIAKHADDILTTPMWNGSMWHAGELETSLMLYVAGDLVDMSRATREFPEVPAGYGMKPVAWRSFLQSGAFGDTTAATAEKGKALFERICEEMCCQIEEARKSEQKTD